MSMDIQIAWRNIWRNPRRTAVILLAVIIGVWSMVFLGALMRGILKGMVENGINTLTGHIQIHQSDYPDDPSVNHSIGDPAFIQQALSGQLPPGSHWTLRVRVNAVASNARHNNGVTLVGIDPGSEARVSFVGTAVTQGRYLDSRQQNGILVGKALAKQFETGLGRKLILMSQDQQGRIASRAFQIQGIFQSEMESTEKKFVFVDLDAARSMLKLGQGVSEVAILLPETDWTGKSTRALKAQFKDRDLQVRSWQEALPLLQAYMEVYNSFILIWFVVVFVAMGFGILNTTLMAVFERIREFGLLKGLGMRPVRIVKGVLIEAFFILAAGVSIGDLLGLASCWVLSFNGIDLSNLAQGVEYAGMARVIFPAVWFRDVAVANLVVLVLGLLVCLYPAIKAARFTPVEAMAHT